MHTGNPPSGDERGLLHADYLVGGEGLAGKGPDGRWRTVSRWEAVWGLECSTSDRQWRVQRLELSAGFRVTLPGRCRRPGVCGKRHEKIEGGIGHNSCTASRSERNHEVPAVAHGLPYDFASGDIPRRLARPVAVGCALLDESTSAVRGRRTESCRNAPTGSGQRK